VRRVAVGRVPDEGHDPPTGGLDRHERRVGDVAVGERRDAGPGEADDLGLETAVEGRLDDQARPAGEVRPDPR